MKISQINNTNLSFRMVGLSENIDKYTESEVKMANDVISSMRVSSKKYDGKTAEKYYEEKGYDFGIYSGKKRNSIDVVGWKHAKNCNRHFSVGTFNNEHPFDMMVIENSVKEDEAEKNKSILATNRIIKRILQGIFVIIGIVSLSMFLINKHKRPELEKPLSEAVDTFLSTSENLMPDTIKAF